MHLLRKGSTCQVWHLANKNNGLKWRILASNIFQRSIFLNMQCSEPSQVTIPMPLKSSAKWRWQLGPAVVSGPYLGSGRPWSLSPEGPRRTELSTLKSSRPSRPWRHITAICWTGNQVDLKCFLLGSENKHHPGCIADGCGSNKALSKMEISWDINTWVELRKQLFGDSSQSTVLLRVLSVPFPLYHCD